MAGGTITVEFNDRVVRRFLLAAVPIPANSLVTLALVTGGMRKAFARDS